jgi:uncharacterized protein YqjF (DUF2071 family)
MSLAEPTTPPGPWCPNPVVRPTAGHRWDDLTFLHWSYAPDVVQSLLPPGLTVETFGGRAWVGLVPFRMTVWRPGLPVPPWVGRFAETNVRTYVQGPDGRTGVWFLSLDAARAAPVAVARTWFGLPYFWSAMSARWTVAAGGSAVLDYRCRRRAPGPTASSRVVVEVGERIAPDDLGPRDHWLTARWGLYAHAPGGLRTVDADHAPWTLHRARALVVDDGLVAATGLPRPAGDPLVHWSPGVEVRIGRQRIISGSRQRLGSVTSQISPA